MKKKKKRIEKKIYTRKQYKDAVRKSHNKGIHEAYQAMELGQDECYCDKCIKKLNKFMEVKNDI